MANPTNIIATQHPNYTKGWSACADYIAKHGAALAAPTLRLQPNAARTAPHWTRGYRAAYKALASA